MKHDEELNEKQPQRITRTPGCPSGKCGLKKPRTRTTTGPPAFRIGKAKPNGSTNFRKYTPKPKEE